MRTNLRYHKIGIIKCDAYHNPIKVCATYDLHQVRLVENMLTILNDSCKPEAVEYIAKDMRICYSYN